MNATAARPRDALEALSLRYLLDYPREAAARLERLPPEAVAAVLAAHSLNAVVPVWEQLAPDIAESVLPQLDTELQGRLLAEGDPAHSALLLSRLDAAERERCLALLPDSVRNELSQLLAFAPDSAGALMDPRVAALSPELTVAEAVERLRAQRLRDAHEIYVVDDEGRLTGRIPALELAMARPQDSLRALMRVVTASAVDAAAREELIELIQRHWLSQLPVTDHAGRLIGVVRHERLFSALQAQTSTDIQTMVGASADERASSSAGFAVAKRLPWLQINLLTAFLAASVVGLFEGTIARFTALAVLLPVVAGQSGNAGAQALAVTMRGLVLREVSLRQWPQLVFKEVIVGLLNGVAVAATTAIGVYLWSRSLGLVLIIACAMVISMIAAGFAGALVPVTLRRFGQDPAASSSIILTTVTDVVGFFSLLGIATLFSGMLEPG